MSALKYVFACEYGPYYFLYVCNLKFEYGGKSLLVSWLPFLLNPAGEQLRHVYNQGESEKRYID